jgi:hypothetical protein
MITNQQSGMANPLSIDEYIDSIWPTNLFSKTETLKEDYGELPYIQRQFMPGYYKKEREWVTLVGIDFYSLPEKKRQFLIQTAGAIGFENKIDIKKIYDTAIY